MGILVIAVGIKQIKITQNSLKYMTYSGVLAIIITRIWAPCGQAFCLLCSLAVSLALSRYLVYQKIVGIS